MGEINPMDSVLSDFIDECKRLFQEAINETVYEAYSPSKYVRTEQLKNKIGARVSGDKLYIYVDTEDMDYFSAQSGSNAVSPAVAWWVEEGHNHREYIQPMYHQYVSNDDGDYIGGRHYLERAQEKIQRTFNIKVKLIKDKPAHVNWR